MHGKRVCTDFKIKNFAAYHDICVQSNILLLVDVFDTSWNVCLEICELHPARFHVVPGLRWQAALKKDQSKVRSFN